MASDDGTVQGDERLFAEAGAGDDHALGSLLERYLPRLRAFVRLHVGAQLRRRESSEDVVQSVCRELVEQRSCLEFPSEAGFRGWLFTAARNKVREKARFHGRKKRDVGREREIGTRDASLSRVYASACSPSRLAAANEQVTRFEAAFDALPEDHREVIALARIAGLPHDIVAERMGRSVGAVRQLLARALLKLFDRLEIPD